MFSDSEVDRFVDNPGEYFGSSLTKMLNTPRAQVEALQLAALKRRFGLMRGRLPMMDKLADAQGIDAVNAINDVLPLLFDHAVYKSYPASLLEKQRYGQLTSWLNKLTTHDISGVDVSACKSIDDWMIAIKRDTPLSICHTSGTTGTMSFLPWSKVEWRRMLKQYPVLFFQKYGVETPIEKPPLNIDCIFPSFRTGGMSHTVVNDAIVDIVAGNEERFHAAYPTRLSADMMLLAVKLRAATANGTLDRLQISPEIASRRADFEKQQREMPARINEFFATMQTQLAGRRVYIQAISSMLFTLAESGMKKGLKKVFAPNSVIVTGGGGKGIVLPPDWKETVNEFFGVERIFNNYGMSEMSTQMTGCLQGNYHSTPSMIPYILDPITMQPLPRKGTVKGQFGFFDLMVDTRWGGFVTADEVTMEWDTPCACGIPTPYLHAHIQRVNANSDDGDDKLSCAASPTAYAEALDFLTAETV